MATYLGSFVQLCCGTGGTLQTNIAGMCGACSQCMDYIGFSPAHSNVLSGSTLLRLQGALQGTVQSGPCACALPRSKAAQIQILEYSTRAQTQFGMRFAPFPGPSSSGDQVLGECTVQGGLCILITFLVLATWFPSCTMRAPFQVCHVSPLGS